MIFSAKKAILPDPAQALPGRDMPVRVSKTHFVTGRPIVPPFPEHLHQALFALGCFWGAERKFWQYPNVFSTMVGYTGGFSVNPSYEEVCTGLTGHAEAVRVLFDPERILYGELLKLFWESHNPTMGMRQGNDMGTQYRSGIYTYNQEQLDTAFESKKIYQERLTQAGFNSITTEIMNSGEFYYAEDYHQQYLAKNPQGYCGLGGCGVNYD
ncbi:MAG: peptide-methionine (S)-S-oxide reductase MsrA [Methylococcaceae bacterium]|nr:peptide-methionine (S)-S-oxide reductase MsrA [Methylococcaceae bacterium]